MAGTMTKHCDNCRRKIKRPWGSTLCLEKGLIIRPSRLKALFCKYYEVKEGVDKKMDWSGDI